MNLQGLQCFCSDRKVGAGWRWCGALWRVVLIVFVSESVSAQENVSEGSAPGVLEVNSGISIGIRSGGLAEVKGTVESIDVARKVLIAVQSARPDLNLKVDGLKVNPMAAPLPILDQIPDFLRELSITTHEWEMWVRPGLFLVSGQTDSVVTHAAFQARLNILKYDSDSLQTRNLICLVSKEDLPETPQNLPEALTDRDEFSRRISAIEEMLAAIESNSDPNKKIQTTDYEPVNYASVGRAFGLTKLQLSGLEVLPLDAREMGLFIADRMDWLFISADRERLAERSFTGLVARPILVSQPIDSAPETGNGERNSVEPRGFVMKAGARMKRDMQVLGEVPFSNQSFTVQVEQMNAISQIAGELKTKALKNGEILLRSRVGGTGTDAFNEWVSAKRVDEVKRMLVSLGIGRSRIQVELKAAGSKDVNPHRVEVLVPKGEIASASIFRKPLRAEPVKGPVEIETGEIGEVGKTIDSDQEDPPDPLSAEPKPRVTIAIPIPASGNSAVKRTPESLVSETSLLVE